MAALNFLKPQQGLTSWSSRPAYGGRLTLAISPSKYWSQNTAMPLRIVRPGSPRAPDGEDEAHRHRATRSEPQAKAGGHILE
jgi:hypothetical protein